MGKMDTVNNTEKLIEFGKRFSEIRKSLGYSQAQIAEYLGVDRTLITKFEKGERNIGVSQIEKVCRLFGCTLAEIDGRAEGFERISVSFRSKDFTAADLESIAAVQSIALNLRKVKNL